MKLFKLLSYTLILLFFLSTVFLRIFDFRADSEHSLFLFLIYTIFIVISSLTISVISAISFMHTGNRAILWMGLGAMVFGLGGGISTGLYEFEIIGINGLVTIYNVLPFLSSACFLLSALLFYLKIEKIRTFSSRLLSLIQHLMSFLVIISLIVFLIIRNLFPVFFIQETGGTLIRSIVIIITILLLLPAGSILLKIYYNKNLKPLFYASISMFLLALGFLGLIFSVSVGSPINWLGRFSHVLAGLYLFFFASSIFSESKKNKVSSTELLDLYFREKIANYRMVFENIHDSILIIDNDENILGYNNAFLNLYEFKESSQCPINMKELNNFIECYKLNGEKISYEKWNIKKALEGDTFANIEEIIKLKETGRKLYTSHCCSPLLDEENKVIGAVQSSRDITSQKEAEENRLKSFKNKMLELERKKIARELHDSVSQALFSSTLFSENVINSWEKDPKKALENLKIIRDLNRSALSDIRLILFNLMPEKIDEENFPALLEKLLGFIQNNIPNIKTQIQINGECDLPKDITHEIYRIAQETINNIIKHSDATSIKVSLDCSPNEVHLLIYDNGSGFDIEKLDVDKTFGINIMKERAGLIGASLSIKSFPKAGTEVILSLKKGIKELSSGKHHLSY